MYVGFMRNFVKPTEMAKLVAIISKFYGIDIIYLRPKDINIETDKVRGKVLIGNKWVEREVDLPPFIDISPYCFKKRNKEIIDYLRNNTFLSDNRLNTFSKEKLQEKLKEDGEFAHLVIPTDRASSFEKLVSYLEQYQKIVLKPLGGERGKGIYILSVEGDKYRLGFKTKEKVITNEELEQFFNESINNKRYIMQKYIASRTLQGDPFDCRVHAEKNGEGKWVSARNYIRIGIGQTVISNVNQGGGIADPEPFLKANFGDRWEEILKRIDELAVTLPYKIEEFRKTHIMSLGMDVGIDKDGKLYIFEVNGAPSTQALKSEAALLRSNYYKYVLEKELKLKIKKRTKKTSTGKMKKKILALESELDYYKKRLAELENSTSWKLTKPVRKLGKIVKRSGK